MENAAEIAGGIVRNVENVIVGKRNVITLMLATLLAEGHALIEDVPGVAKTMLARALAKSIGCAFTRVQCTPDLLPTDVTGVSVFNQKTTEFEFRDVRIRFSKDGTMAWFSCHLDDCGIWKGEEFCVADVRNTGVLEKRGDQWTIVQSHASWPVDKIPDDIWRRLVQAKKESADEE